MLERSKKMSMLRDVNAAVDAIPIVIRWPILFLAAIGLINFIPGLLKVTWVVALAMFLLWIFGRIGDDSYKVAKEKMHAACEAASLKIAEKISEKAGEGGAA